MAQRRRWRLEGGASVHAVFSGRGDGDLAISGGAAELEDRRGALAPLPWTWLEQVHGARVVPVQQPGDRAGESADGSVTSCERSTLAVQVADCAPVLMFGAAGSRAVVAAVHAGWRGIEAGVLANAVEEMRRQGAGRLSWTVGPCISPAAYEFSPPDLDRLAAALGDSVRARTETGSPALDVRAAVASAMAAAGVTDAPLEPVEVCTALSPEHWSHRATGDTERQVGAIWWERTGRAG